MKTKILFVALFVLLAALFSAVMVDAQGPKPGSRAPLANAGTAFTYQGQLKNGGAGVNGACDFQFGLWDALTVGAQVGTTQTVSSVAVSNGLFTTPIDFGASAFTGDARWLAIAVNCGSGLTALNPRQALTPVPMALALPGLYTRQNATSPNIIGGYSGNVISPTVVGGTISGGGYYSNINLVTDNYGTVGGGINNQAGDNTGPPNDKPYATVGGGGANTASGYAATVGGGAINTASGQYTTVPGGKSNAALGNYSIAAGRRAKANHDGAFVWGDSTDMDVASSANNQFLIRASGGVTMYTNFALSAGVRVLPGSGSWSSVSDKNLKANFTNVNGRVVLDALANVPIQSWNYKSQDATIRHIGPMAQDFYAAFNVGEDDTHIATIDADGIALAAIQGLNQVVQEKEARIAALESRLTALEQNAQTNNLVNSNNVAMIAIGVLLGIIVAQRMWHRGEQ